MESVLNWSVIISIIGVLVVLTNIGADARRFLCILFHQGDRCCVVYGVCRGGPRVHGGLCGNVRI